MLALQRRRDRKDEDGTIKKSQSSSSRTGLRNSNASRRWGETMTFSPGARLGEPEVMDLSTLIEDAFKGGYA